MKFGNLASMSVSSKLVKFVKRKTLRVFTAAKKKNLVWFKPFVWAFQPDISHQQQGVFQISEVIFPDISLISTLFSLIQYRSWANTTLYAYQW